MSVFKIRYPVLTESPKEFLIPPTILSDYENYLMTHVPNAVFDFQVLHSWYDLQNKDEKAYVLRAEYFPINWKSKVGNSDMNYNFYTDTQQDIRKGDLAIREDGLILMLNWNIQDYINARTTQAIECNHTLLVTREVPAKADKRGMLIEAAHKKTIVEPIPCVMSEYAGRPDFAVAQNAPGIHADMLTVCDVQYNAQTNNIQEMDEIVYGNYTYRVVHIDQTQIATIARYSENADGFTPFGIIRLYLRKVAGEDQ